MTVKTWARFPNLPWERAILNMSLHDKLIMEVLKTYEGIYFRYPEIIALSKIIALNLTLSESEAHDAHQNGISVRVINSVCIDRCFHEK